MGSMPEYDMAALEENADRIDVQVKDIKAKIADEVTAKAAHDDTIMALGAGVDRLESDAKHLRRLAEQIRQADVERIGRSGDAHDRQAGNADDARDGRAT